MKMKIGDQTQAKFFEYVLGVVGKPSMTRFF